MGERLSPEDIAELVADMPNVVVFGRAETPRQEGGAE
jgi:hypothetical protein